MLSDRAVRLACTMRCYLLVALLALAVGSCRAQIASSFSFSGASGDASTRSYGDATALENSAQGDGQARVDAESGGSGVGVFGASAVSGDGDTADVYGYSVAEGDSVTYSSADASAEDGVATSVSTTRASTNFDGNAYSYGSSDAASGGK